MDTYKAINKIYNEREDFIVIGLTGRTGSGCSTVANILRESKFNNLDLRLPKSYDFHNSEERKYSIIYEYSKLNYKKPFEVIEMSNIIASFIFEKGYKAFSNYIDELMNNKKIQINTLLLNSISILEGEIDIIQKKLNDIDYGKIKEENNEILYVYNILMPEITEKLKNIVKGFVCKVNGNDSQLYTYLFQQIGNNLRASGDPFDPQFESEKFFTLAERTNLILKAIKYNNKNKEPKAPTLICIDALRNPFEATFFKDRYSAFYLISVNTDDSSRRKRLSHLNADEIDSLDKIEYPDKLERKEKFYNQNINACLEIADIHIYNPDVDEKKYYFLTEQLLKYFVLMIHPGLVTPTHIERCMQIAYNAKLNSGCLSRQVGAVVTGEDYSIKSVGWNEVPKGHVSCSLRDVRQYCQNKDRESYSNYEITDYVFSETMEKINGKIVNDNWGGRKYPYCFKDIYNELKDKDNQVHTRALHAEENAFLQISKHGGVGVKGDYLFTTASPCELCAKKAYHLGIKKIYYIDPYPGISQSHILKFGSSDNPEMNLFYGAIGNAHISLYTPKMPYKDELEMITGCKTKELIEKKKTEGVVT
jgi:dCMP deaminase